MISKCWTADAILELSRSFQPACILAAGADWNVFSALARGPMTAASLSSAIGADERAIATLLDALVALQLLTKDGDEYGVPTTVARLCTDSGEHNILPMLQHQANCLRRWAQLSHVVGSGQPAERVPSIRGEQADQAAFIGAMDNISSPVANALIAEVCTGRFTHLLDIGGASGTWTIAFLRAMPRATATIFDLPDVIPMARQRIQDAGLIDRITFQPGDFYTDDLPTGADLVWLSAIAHQNSREQNRNLFMKTHRALRDQGVLLIRDVVMDESHTLPLSGAMFAVNMLVATEGGGTYTLNEFKSDLHDAGFDQVVLMRSDPWMNSIIRAIRA